MEEAVVFAFALPAIAIVAVVRRDHHDVFFVIENGANVHVSRRPALAVVIVVIIMIIFPSDVVIAAVWVEAAYPLVYIRGLQSILGGFDIENAVKESVSHIQLLEIAFGQDPFDGLGKIISLFLPPEIVRH